MANPHTRADHPYGGGFDNERHNGVETTTVYEIGSMPVCRIGFFNIGETRVWFFSQDYDYGSDLFNFYDNPHDAVDAMVAVYDEYDEWVRDDFYNENGVVFRPVPRAD